MCWITTSSACLLTLTGLDAVSVEDIVDTWMEPLVMTPRTLVVLVVVVGGVGSKGGTVWRRGRESLRL